MNNTESINLCIKTKKEAAKKLMISMFKTVLNNSRKKLIRLLLKSKSQRKRFLKHTFLTISLVQR